MHQRPCRASLQTLSMISRLLLACFLTEGGQGIAKEQPSMSPDTFIWLSDVHWNPTSDPDLLDKLMHSEIAQWQSILAASRSTTVSKWGEDTNWPLLRSTTAAARQADASAAFIVVTGDLFPHHFREQLAAALPGPLDDNAFRSFARKTFEFVLAQLQTVAPGKPLFYVLGNNDDTCDDYAVQPSGPFLADTADSVLASLHAAADAGQENPLRKDWLEGGHYDVGHPTTPNLRIIGLNSVFLSARYQNRCAESGTNSPGEEELIWLQQHLETARSHNQKAWILTHIPPGLDGFATERERRNDNGHTLVPLWRPDFATRFAGLLSQYHSTIAIMFAAHIHSDAFRIINGTVALLTPSVSPNIRQDPAFRVVSEDGNGVILDQKTWTLNNLAAAASSPGIEPNWQLEYDFNQTWDTKRVDEQSLGKLWSQIEGSKTKQEQWMRLYVGAGSRSGPPPPVSWPQFCASGYADNNNFNACLHRHIASEAPN